MATGQLTKSYRTTAYVEGVGDLGVWDTHSGIEIDSDEQKYRAGDGVWLSLGGQSEPANVTVTRILQRERDMPLMGRLLDAAGKAGGYITQQPLDEDGSAWGPAMQAKGTFKRVKLAESDSNARSDPSMMELEFTIVTVVSA